MSSAQLPGKTEIIYPDSDGRRMADNTLQWDWIATIKIGLETLYLHDPDVFVAGDLLWYPVEGDNKTRTAPDALVAFGRPKGYRGSYRQWEEGGIAPQVVFEVLSPGNRSGEMKRKLRFYERFGVEEYYIYNPYKVALEGWLRSGESLGKIVAMDGWVSPRLGIRFDLSGGEFRIFGPDGRLIESPVEAVRQRDEADRQRDQIARQRDEANRLRDEADRLRDEADRLRDEANRQRDEADRQRDEVARQRHEERQQAERLRARLRELGIEPE